jgi:hypothetical protein
MRRARFTQPRGSKMFGFILVVVVLPVVGSLLVFAVGQRVQAIRK